MRPRARTPPPSDSISPVAERAPERIELAGLGRRFGALLLDRVPVAIIAGAWYWLTATAPAQTLVLSVAAFVLLAAWVLVQWWAYATRKAGLGYRVFGLELVGTADGRAIGWWRMFLRAIVLSGSWVIVLPGIVATIMLIIDDRRQGWHDRAAKSLAVRRVETRTMVVGAPTFAGAPSQSKAAGIVPLPPHLLASAFEQHDEPAPAAPIQHVPLGDAASTGPWVGQNPNQAAPPSAPAAPVNQPSQGLPKLPPPTPVGAPSTSTQPRPGVPNLPPPTQAAPPAQPPTPVRQGTPVARVRQRNTEQPPVDDYSGTRLVANPTRPPRRPASGGWYLQLDDGRSIELTSLVLIGRAPAPRPEEAGTATLVEAGEPAQTVSKTHLVLGADARGVYVSDRNSTNGTALIGPDGSLEPCPAGVQTRVREGQVVSFGDRSLRVLRRSS